MHAPETSFPPSPAKPSDVVVSLVDLRLSYPSPEGEIAVLRGVDLAVRAGEIVAVTGPSGSGKSSLIAVVGGLETPTGGSVRVLGTALESADERTRTALRRRDIGIVFQAYHLVPAMTALENVALPLVLAGEEGGEAAAQAMLREVGLGHRMSHRPSSLSGGEQQRVAVARAFVAGPRLVLADEPTGNLDRRTGEHVAQVMFSLTRASGAALVLVTHDEALARACDRIVAIDEGRIVEERVVRDPVAAGARG
ncbi:ABC transporter ATP-binding protein [Salinarimonas ramus]|uniref:ABC transporter n=1 Tax=Salinarimonas ramus TaxID=690164 RepID=A0A917QB65_9HYPH|nr:ABC transporter ATP-binding protein [Salinarimonas ramus]GGK41277.1 ABC transporter [Salinarimonas ramus]